MRLRPTFKHLPARVDEAVITLELGVRVACRALLLAGRRRRRRAAEVEARDRERCNGRDGYFTVSTSLLSQIATKLHLQRLRAASKLKRKFRIALGVFMQPLSLESAASIPKFPLN
ncbi:hypothetical protein B0H13DRAFT_1874320 [Mycena leptocephala]|nr:hypothetical protein B0H13DRAFT_1874320 [Mycena leptocephala]